MKGMIDSAALPMDAEQSGKSSEKRANDPLTAQATGETRWTAVRSRFCETLMVPDSTHAARAEIAQAEQKRPVTNRVMQDAAQRVAGFPGKAADGNFLSGTRAGMARDRMRKHTPDAELPKCLAVRARVFPIDPCRPAPCLAAGCRNATGPAA